MLSSFLIRYLLIPPHIYTIPNKTNPLKIYLAQVCIRKNFLKITEKHNEIPEYVHWIVKALIALRSEVKVELEFSHIMSGTEVYRYL